MRAEDTLRSNGILPALTLDSMQLKYCDSRRRNPAEEDNAAWAGSKQI